MKRAQLNNRIQQLKDEKRIADINFNSAVNTLELMRGKIKEMMTAIEKIKNPSKFQEEAKKLSPKRRRTKKSTKKL